MKNILWTLVFVALTGSVLAVQFGDKKTLTFSTQGPDLYADGTTVLDNEQYALVYVSPGATFGGFYTDGSLVNTTSNQVVCTLPAAKDGKCSEQRVQFALRKITIPKGFGGTNLVVMLDTRAPDTATTGKLGELIMGWGIAGETAGISEGTVVIKEAVSMRPARSAREPQLPKDVGAPVITGIDVKEDKVLVTVKNVSPKAYYALNATDDIKKDKSLWKKSERAKHKQGVASGTVVLEYPLSDSAKLFQVVTPTTN